MKILVKLLGLVGLILIVVGCVSCGHNLVGSSKGWGLDLTSGKSAPIGLRIGSWDYTYTIVRENVEAEVTSAATLAAISKTKKEPMSVGTTSDTESDDTVRTGSIGNNAGGTIKIRTGMQTTGYLREILSSPNANPATAAIAESVYAAEKERAKREEPQKPIVGTSTTTAGQSSTTSQTTAPTTAVKEVTTVKETSDIGTVTETKTIKKTGTDLVSEPVKTLEPIKEEIKNRSVVTEVSRKYKINGSVIFWSIVLIIALVARYRIVSKLK